MDPYLFFFLIAIFVAVSVLIHIFMATIGDKLVKWMVANKFTADLIFLCLSLLLMIAFIVWGVDWREL